MRQLTKNSFNQMTDFVEGFIPTRVEIESIYEVRNYYEDGTIVSAGQETEGHYPLF